MGRARNPVPKPLRITADMSLAQMLQHCTDAAELAKLTETERDAVLHIILARCGPDEIAMLKRILVVIEARRGRVA